MVAIIEDLLPNSYYTATLIGVQVGRFYVLEFVWFFQSFYSFQKISTFRSLF